MSAFNVLTLDISNPAKPKRIPSDSSTFDFLAVRIGASNLTIAEATGHFDFSAKKLTNVADPTDPQDAATRAYVLSQVGGTGDFSDSAFRISDNGDPTKKTAFEVSAITAATVRTITMPDANVDLGNIANLITLSGVAANAVHLGTFTGSIIPDSSTIKAALQALETEIEGLPTPMVYKGVWNAAPVAASFTGQVAGMTTDVTITANVAGTAGNSVSLPFDGVVDITTAIATWNGANPGNQVTLSSGNGAQVPDNATSIALAGGINDNTPALADGVGSTGDLYRVSVAGSENFGSGVITFEVGDMVVYNGATWEKWDVIDAVITVNGQSGVVTLDTDDIGEGSTNLYFTDERAQDAVGTILTDTNSIDLTYNDGSGIVTADVKVNAAGAITISSTGIQAVVDGSTMKIASNALAVDHAVTKTNDNAGSITVRQVVYVKADGDVDLAIATNTGLFDAEIGLVEDATIATTAAGKITLRRGAIVGGFTGLTPGKKQYISRTVAGDLVEDLTGFVATNQVISVGKAISATEIAFDPEYLFEY